MSTPDDYTCRETFRRIHDYVDRELTPEEMRLCREHLETCVRCAREFVFEAQVIDDLRTKLRRVSAPPGLKANLLAAIRAKQDPRAGH